TSEPAFTGAKRQLDDVIGGEAMPLVEGRKPTLRAEILIILGNDGSATADARCVVYGFREHIRAADGNTVLHALAQAHGGGVQDGITFRRLPEEWLRAGDAPAKLIRAGRAHHGEVRALRAVAGDVQDQPPR